MSLLLVKKNLSMSNLIKDQKKSGCTFNPNLLYSPGIFSTDQSSAGKNINKSKRLF